MSTSGMAFFLQINQRREVRAGRETAARCRTEYRTGSKQMASNTCVAMPLTYGNQIAWLAALICR